MLLDTQNWHWQQWFYIIVWGLCLVGAPLIHGKTKEGKHNGFTTIISIIVSFYVLYSAGFFK